MLAFINFKNTIGGGWCKRLKLFLFPKISIVSVPEDEFINTECCSVEVAMPIDSERCKAKALQKLLKCLEEKGCNSFITVKGEYTEYLKNAGYKTGDYTEYIKQLLPDAVTRLCEITAATPDMLKICLHDPKFEDRYGTILYKLIKLCKTIVYVTDTPDEAQELLEEIYEQTGSAVIAGDGKSKISGVDITVSLTDTENLIKEGIIPYGTVIFTADRNFIPKAYLPYTVINSFGVDMPESLIKYMPNGLRPWEFIGNLYDITANSQLLALQIYSFYSFGRSISEKSIVESIIGLDKKRSL